MIKQNGLARTVWGAALGVALAATAFYLTSSLSDFGGDLLYLDQIGDVYVGDIVYIGTLAIAAVACILRAALVRADRAAWALIGLGACGWVAGEVGFAIQLNAEGRVPYPSYADVLFLSQYPLTVVGILLLLRGRYAGTNPRALLDGMIGFSAAAALGVALLGPVLADIGARRTEAMLTNLSYPLVDVIVIALIFGALGLVGRRSLDRAFLMLLASFTAVAIADGLFLYLESTGGYYDVHPVDALWMLAAVLLVAAAWMRPRPVEHWLGPALRVGAPLLLAIAAIIEVAISGSGRRVEDVALYLAALTMLAVIARLLITVADNERLLAESRTEADTDPLTGLANRRRLMLDLERAAREAAGGGPTLRVAIYDLNGFKAYNDSFGHAAGDALLRRCGRNLDHAVAGRARAYRLGGDEFCVLIREGEGKTEATIAAAAAALTEPGEGFQVDNSFGTASVPSEAGTASEALQLADHRMYAEKGQRATLADLQARDLLMQVVSEREPELDGHVRSVSDLARRLAREAGLEGEDLEQVVRCGELHDIGKMAIPDEVVHKASPLTDEEWELMRRHTLIGERILSVSPALRGVARLVRSSHERWDGGGYPDGLAGEEIPVGSRITLICDAWDSIVGDRPYDPPRPSAEAAAELRRHAGTQFDPDLVELFCERVVPAIEAGAVLPTGRDLSGAR